MPIPSLPQTLYIGRIESPIGTILLIHDREGQVRALDFQDFDMRMRRLLRLHYGKEGEDFTMEPRTAPAAAVRALASYFAGDLTALDGIPVATAGTSFQREVWAALRKIQPGTAMS